MKLLVTKRIAVTAATILMTLLLSACATKHNPDEVCTAEWIKPRVDLALGDFRANTDTILNTLKKTGSEVASSGGQLGLLQRAGVLLSLTKLVSTFQNGQTLKDLNVLSETCNQPELASRVFKDVLSEYNVPPAFLNLLDEMQQFKDLATQAAQDLQ